MGAAATHSTVALYGEDGDTLLQSTVLERDAAQSVGDRHCRRGAAFRRDDASVGVRGTPAAGAPWHLDAAAEPSSPAMADARGRPFWRKTRTRGCSVIAASPCLRTVPDPTSRPGFRRALPSIWPASCLLTSPATDRASLPAPRQPGHPLRDERPLHTWCQRKHLPRAAYSHVVPRAMVRHPKQGVSGLDAALARDWQTRSASRVSRSVAATDRRLDPQRRLAARLEKHECAACRRSVAGAAVGGVDGRPGEPARPGVPELRLLFEDHLQDRRCTA